MGGLGAGNFAYKVCGKQVKFLHDFTTIKLQLLVQPYLVPAENGLQVWRGVHMCGIVVPAATIDMFYTPLYT